MTIMDTPGHRFRFREDDGVQEEAPPPPPGELFRDARQVTIMAGDYTCANRHFMGLITTVDFPGRCDLCNRTVAQRQCLYCRKCDFHLCFPCCQGISPGHRLHSAALHIGARKRHRDR